MNLIQFISQHPTESAAIAGVAMVIVGQIVKKTGLAGQYVAAGLAVIVGISYTAFTTFVPVEVQQNVVAFAGTAFATSWTLYELMYKPVRKMITGQ